MVKYELNRGLYPYPLSYLQSDGGTVPEAFVSGDPTVAPDSNNWYVLCLTPDELLRLSSIIAAGAPIVYPDTYNQDWQKWAQMREFPNEIPENSCMDICQLVLDCIESNVDIQQAIGRYALTSGIGTDTSENETILDTNLSGNIVSCNKDNYFGMCRQLADWLNAVSEDILELFVTAFAAPARLGDLIEAIPVVGELPADDILQSLEKFAEQINDAYQAAYDTQLNEDIACLFFCLGQDDCILTFEMARDAVQSMLTETVSNTDFVTIINDIIANNWLGEQGVWIMHWFILDTIIFGGEILGIDHNRVLQTISTFYNDPDSDWSTLCTDCAWTHTWLGGDGNPQDDGWTITIGSYDSGNDRIEWELFSGSNRACQVIYTLDGDYTLLSVVLEWEVRSPTTKNQGVGFYTDSAPIVTDIDPFSSATLQSGAQSVSEETDMHDGYRIIGTLNSEPAPSCESYITKITVTGIGADPFSA